MSKVFVYGTLLVPSVMQAVTGQTFESDKAILHNYARYKVKGHVFPGIIETENQSVEGILYKDVDKVILQRLNVFESYIYYRKEVMVSLANHKHVPAYTYVIAPEFEDKLTGLAWELEEFTQFHLEKYMERICKTGL
ncbi:MAG: gamma-glutamylcyclotransferase family protein [Gammaproteobacteria bacterium]